jgi:hypothetical protein
VRILYFLLLSIIIISCESLEPIETLGEYEIPFEANKQRVYTYLTQPTADTVVHVYQFSDYAEKSYFQKIYIAGDIQFERFYKYKGNHKELIKEYYYDWNSDNTWFNKLEGEIKDNQQIDVGSKYKGQRLKMYFDQDDGFRWILKEEDQSIEETQVQWQGDSLQALKIYYTGSMKHGLKYFPPAQRGEEYKGEAWFAKGIGLIENKYIYSDETYTLKLISIDSVFHPVQTWLLN